MSDTSINKIIQYGTTAERIAFTPDPALTSQVLYIWYDSDNSPDTYVWDGSIWVQINPSGSGDVVGPASSVNNRIAIFNGVTGKLLADGGQTIAAAIAAAVAASGNVVGPGSTVSGHLAVFSGTSGKIIADGGAVPSGGITELTGDITAGPGSGSQAASIASNAVVTGKINAKAVTYAKIQDVSVTARLLGRATAGAGVIEEITLGTNLSLSGTTLNATGGGGGGAGWTFVTSAAASGAAVDFTGLSAYNEILVIIKAVTATGACIRQLLVSSDNGSTFHNASGDYVTIDSNGAESNSSVLSFDNGNNSSAHSGWIQISLFNDANSPLKPANASFPTTNTVQAVNLATAMNAIRVRPHTNSFNGGNIYVFGR